MPFQNPEDRVVWRKANVDRIKDHKRRHRARKAELGIPQDVPLDPAKRVAYLEKRTSQRDAGLARLAAYILQQKEEAALHRPARLERRRHISRVHRHRLRLQAIHCMGGACEWCGFDVPEALEFDHVKPILRKTAGVGTRQDSDRAYRKIIRGEWKNEVQLLCACCHALKTRADHSGSGRMFAAAAE